MDGHFPFEFIGFWAMDGHFPYAFIGFWAMDGNFPYEFIGFGVMDGHFRGHSGVWGASAPKDSPGYVVIYS